MACTAALAGAPGLSSAIEEGFHLGLSASLASLDAEAIKTTDNAHPMNATASSGRIFGARDSDDKTTSGFGILAGYTFLLNDRGLYLSGEVDLAYHGGKVRGQLAWVRDSIARERAGSDPDWPQSGESWPDAWAFGKDHSYGLTLRLGGRPEFLSTLLGPDAGLYLLAGIRRVETEYLVTYEGCPRVEGCPDGREDESYTRGHDRVETDDTAWTAGAGLYMPAGERLDLQVETYYTDYGKEEPLRLDKQNTPHIGVTHALKAEEVGLRIRLLRFF